MMSKYLPAAAWSNSRGTTAVEFAIVVPVAITLFVGSLYLCMALFVAGSLHYAVEEGARCASVNTSTCGNAGAITSYAKTHYFGPGSAPTFSYAAAACGNSVSATVSYAANLGFTMMTIPISAAACFP